MMIAARLVVGVLVMLLAACDGGDGSSRSAAWVAVGPDGGNVQSLAVDPRDPETVYAGTQLGGIFRSRDGGESWTSVGLVDLIVFAIAVDPVATETVYAAGTRVGTADGDLGGLFRSADGGRTWTQSDTGLIHVDPTERTQAVTALAIDLAHPETLYAGTMACDPLFRSDDGARTWRPILGRPDVCDRVTAIVVDPTHPTTVLAGFTEYGVFASRDGGATWSPSNAGLASPRYPGLEVLGVTALVVDPHHPAALFAGTGLDGVYTSRDGGAQWTSAGAVGFDYVWALAIDPRHPANVFATGFGGCDPTRSGRIARSSDAGATWERSAAPPSDREITALAIDPHAPATIYAGSVRDGVLRSTDAGARFAVRTHGITNQEVARIVVDPRRASTVYAIANGEVLASADAGASWHRLDVGVTAATLALDPHAPDTLYVGGSRLDTIGTGRGIRVSLDAGASWQLLALPEDYIGVIAVDPVRPATLYVGTTATGFPVGGEIRRTTDGGATWTTLLRLDDVDDFVSAIAIDPQTPTTLYVAHRFDGVLASSDDGQTWSPRNAGLAVDVVRNPFLASVTALAFDPDDSATLYAATQTGVFLTHDHGIGWTVALAVPGPSLQALAVVVDPADRGIVYAGIGGERFNPPGTTGGGVFWSRDAGLTWQPLGDDFPPIGVAALGIASGASTRLYAGTQGVGIYARDGD